MDLVRLKAFQWIASGEYRAAEPLSHWERMAERSEVR